MNPQTWNRYAYVTNKPLSATDPSGLDPGDRILQMEARTYDDSCAGVTCSTTYVNGIEVRNSIGALLLSSGDAVNIGSISPTGFSRGYAYTVTATDQGVGFDYFGIGYGTARFELG